MKIKVYSLTTDGDNLAVETTVFATLEQARAVLIEGLASYGVQRGKDGHKLAASSDEELCELWTEAADGVCMLEQHELEVAQ